MKFEQKHFLFSRSRSRKLSNILRRTQTETGHQTRPTKQNSHSVFSAPFSDTDWNTKLLQQFQSIGWKENYTTHLSSTETLITTTRCHRHWNLTEKIACNNLILNLLLRVLIWNIFSVCYVIELAKKLIKRNQSIVIKKEKKLASLKHLSLWAELFNFNKGGTHINRKGKLSYDSVISNNRKNVLMINLSNPISTERKCDPLEWYFMVEKKVIIIALLEQTTLMRVAKVRERDCEL